MVFVPGISRKKRALERRKGGGGGGRGGGGGIGGGRGSSGGKGASGGGRAGSVTSGGAPRSTSSKSAGGGPVSTIPQGVLFAGRQQGGGTRANVYGTSTYGSGYPGSSSIGVASQGFPYYYWPVIWAPPVVVGTGYWIHSNGEYGDSHNTSRPGGALATAAFPSSTNGNTTFRLMADGDTVTSLITDISSSCGSSISSASSISSQPYNDSGPPLPAQAVQYYRASSVVLSLDSYNNTAVYSNDTNTPPSPLPDNIDTTLLSCLNTTIGNNVPLVDAANGLRWSSPSSLGLVALVWAISKLISQV
ncbi:hypothetical protein AN958_02736 [Leucoagaricus sp. SymC.cos]|nr:hypothetical protein AN958_02736 [Leucoagaricus sp. SymC.cos]